MNRISLHECARMYFNGWPHIIGVIYLCWIGVNHGKRAPRIKCLRDAFKPYSFINSNNI